jgi:hypothetical protein
MSRLLTLGVICLDCAVKTATERRAKLDFSGP